MITFEGVKVTKQMISFYTLLPKTELVASVSLVPHLQNGNLNF